MMNKKAQIGLFFSPFFWIGILILLIILSILGIVFAGKISGAVMQIIDFFKQFGLIIIAVVLVIVFNRPLVAIAKNLGGRIGLG